MQDKGEDNNALGRSCLERQEQEAGGFGGRRVDVQEEDEERRTKGAGAGCF
jgi:hypothetical protein